MKPNLDGGGQRRNRYGRRPNNMTGTGEGTGFKPPNMNGGPRISSFRKNKGRVSQNKPTLVQTGNYSADTGIVSHQLKV